MAFDQDPAVAAMLPAMRHPDRAAMRGANPVAVNPDVTMAIPAVIAVDPDPTLMRWMVVDFDDRLGGSHANDDLRKSSGRHETDSKQQRQCSFFHRDFALHGKYPSTRIEEAFRAINFINTRLRISLRGIEKSRPLLESWVESWGIPIESQSLLFTFARANANNSLRTFDAALLGGVVRRQGIFRPWCKNVAQALNLGAHAAQLILNVLVAAVHVVDTIDNGLSVGNQRGQHQRSGSAQVRAHDGG